MPSGLSYPALKCVLEFLEPPKRFLITARSQSLQRVCKSTTLRVNRLENYETGLCLDNFDIGTFRNNAVLLKNEKNKRQVVNQAPSHLIQKEVVEKVKEFYMSGKLCVNQASFEKDYPENPFSLPSNFQLKTNNLDTPYVYFDHILSKIDSTCFPLNSLTIDIEEPVSLIHPVINSARYLEVFVPSSSQIIKFPNIHVLPNKNVVFFNSNCGLDDLVGIIRYWAEHGRETGTDYFFAPCEFFATDDRLHGLDEVFAEFRSDHGDEQPESPRLSIPIINSTSKINVYGNQRRSWASRGILMKVEQTE